MRGVGGLGGSGNFSHSKLLSKPTEISQTEMWIVNSDSKLDLFSKGTAKMLTICEGANQPGC